MAGGHSDYTHGTMEVAAQTGTFAGFMGGTKYGGSLIALFRPDANSCFRGWSTLV